MAPRITRRTVCVCVLLCCASFTSAQNSQCMQLVDAYNSKHSREAKPYTDASQTVFFLHIPRTAGRTFHSCFLKMGTHPSRRCPKAYDHLRLNTSVPNCHLLSSHDDFSVVSMLPDNVAVLTHLRDPVDRFLSAYEFAIEVASRMLTRPPNFKKRPDKVATEDVWPWSQLIPFFQQDMRPRITTARAVPQPETGQWIKVNHPDGDEYYYNKVQAYSKWNLTDDEKQLLLPPIDPYNNPLVMPLEEFVRHPVAQELLHNGETFQVLGITNYSHFQDSGNLRECFWNDQATQDKLNQKAKDRISRFIHVGATDRLADSVAAASVAIKFKMDGTAYGGGDEDTAKTVGPDGKAVEKPKVTPGDLPDLATQVREARFKLQTAQRQLFRATQIHTSDEELERLKTEVAELRLDLKGLQDKLLEARSQLPTSTDPDTPGRQLAEEHTQSVLRAKRLPNALGVEYQRCAQRAQARNLQRRDNSLYSLAMPDGRYVQFNKEARKRIPQHVIDDIRQRNKADLELYALGRSILDKNRAQWEKEGLLESLPPVPAMQLTPRANMRRFNIPKPTDANTLEEL